MERKCENCTAFEPNGNTMPDPKTGIFVAQGECRSETPKVGGYAELRWPLVLVTEWCRKFASKAEADLFELPDGKPADPDATTVWYDQNAPATVPFVPPAGDLPAKKYDGPILQFRPRGGS